MSALDARLIATAALALVATDTTCRSATRYGAPRELTEPCGGALRVDGALAAGASQRWTVCYRTRTQAVLRLQATGGGDLDCYVYGPDRRPTRDPRRVPVARDDADADACAVEWRVASDGDYDIEIVNVGGAQSEYHLTAH